VQKGLAAYHAKARGCCTGFSESLCLPAADEPHGGPSPGGRSASGPCSCVARALSLSTAAGEGVRTLGGKCVSCVALKQVEISHEECADTSALGSYRWGASL
jgi:hypothetical protein